MAEQYATLTDYVGRTVDIAAFKGWKENSHVEVTQALVLPGKNGELIAGIEKLVQRFAIELLTEATTLTYLPARGTEFITAARSGQWQTTGDVKSAFNSSLVSLAENLQAEEDAADPADERFGSAELISVSLFGDSVTLSVRITSLAGTTFTALLPLTVTPY